MILKEIIKTKIKGGFSKIGDIGNNVSSLLGELIEDAINSEMLQGLGAICGLFLGLVVFMAGVFFGVKGLITLKEAHSKPGDDYLTEYTKQHESYTPNHDEVERGESYLTEKSKKYKKKHLKGKK